MVYGHQKGCIDNFDDIIYSIIKIDYQELSLVEIICSIDFTEDINIGTIG